MKKIVLVDGNSMIFKAYYATAHTGNLMKAPDGTTTNALRTTANMINKLIKDRNPDNMLVAFDAGKKTFRHEQLKDYKAGRSKTPDELREQFPLVKEFLIHYGLEFFQIENFEADDIIATIAKKAADKNYKVEVFSSDKDLLQLVNKNVSVFLTNKGVSNIEEINVDNFESKYNITPDQVTDLKGLMGDKSDNIPGIPGVGEKTAVKLINEYGNIENIIQNIDNLKGKLKERFEENKNQALLCKKIATLFFDVEIEKSFEDMEYSSNKFNKDEMTKFLQKYAMNSLLKTLNLKTTSNIKFDFEILKDIPENFEVTNTAINVELKDDNYNMSKIIGLSISNKEKNIYIDSENFAKAKNLKNFLKSDSNKIVFDTAKTKNSLEKEGFEINGIVFDVKLASYIIDHKLTPDIFRIEQFFINTRTIAPDEEVYGKGAKWTIPSLSVLAKHSISKSKWLFNNQAIFKELITNNKLDKLYFDIELPLSLVLAQMEQTGVLINKNILKELEIKAKEKLKLLEQEIHRISDEEFNVASPSQLGIILFEKLGLKGKKTKTGQYSTANEVLVDLIDQHEIIQYIILHRKYSKLLSTYILGIEEFIQEDKRIHTNYNQTLTQTGRLSSKYPNLQNISIKNNIQKEIRKAFVAAPGKVLAAFDYSQIELRILADVSNCQDLITAFEKGEDIHTQTASKVFNIDLEQVSKTQRNKAKAVNFGIIYGISDFGLSKQLRIPIWEAKEIISAYKEAYPEIEVYRQKCIEEAKEKGFVETMFGRKRFIPELESSSHIRREFGKRAATNAPIQGAASDIIKIAMVNIDKKIKKFNIDAKMILQIHDELVFEISNNDLSNAKNIILHEMINAADMKVKLEVNEGHGINLFDIK